MVKLKKYNYFKGKNPNDVSSVISSVCKFFELEGLSSLLLYKCDYKPSEIKYIISNNMKYENLKKFKELITDKSILFRLDILILDLNHETYETHLDFIRELNHLENIKFIILSNNTYNVKGDNNIRIFNCYREFNILDFTANEYIEDVNNGWKTDTESLKKSYIRSKKLNDLLND